MKAKSQPKAPNAQRTIKQQSNENRGAAETTFKMNAVSQNTPTGSLSYEKGKDGSWTATQTLSPNQKTLLSGIEKTGIKGVNTGLAQLGNSSEMYSKPIDLSDPNIGTEISDRLRPQFDATWDRTRQARSAELANKGIYEGSEAYVNAMRDYDANRDDSWNRVATNSRGQIVDEMITGRNQPLTEIAALTSFGTGAQRGPGYVQTPQVNVGPVNTAGIQQQSFENELAKWQQEEQSRQAMIGGLFGLGGAVLTGGLGGIPGMAAGGLAGMGGSTPRFPSGATSVGPYGYA